MLVLNLTLEDLYISTPPFAVLLQIALPNEPSSWPVCLPTPVFSSCFHIFAHIIHLLIISFIFSVRFGCEHWGRCGSCGTLRVPAPLGIQFKKQIRIIFLPNQIPVCSSCSSPPHPLASHSGFMCSKKVFLPTGWYSDPALHCTTRTFNSVFSELLYLPFCHFVIYCPMLLKNIFFNERTGLCPWPNYKFILYK